MSVKRARWYACRALAVPGTGFIIANIWSDNPDVFKLVLASILMGVWPVKWILDIVIGALGGDPDVKR